MKVLCYGSMNIDMVFSVPHFVKAGETLSSFSMTKNAGGKGANQAGALAKAGCNTYMAGKVGKDGLFLVDGLKEAGIDCSHVIITDNPSGQAIIQLDENSQNAIILLAGENKNIRREEIDATLSDFSSGDWVVLQNEINEIGYIIMKAKERGMRICFNPAPYEASVLSLPIDSVDLLILNEIEGADMAGLGSDAEHIDVIQTLHNRYPGPEIVLTEGKKGSYYVGREGLLHQDIIDYPVLDTTAAGDTFIGYFLASVISGCSVKEALVFATKGSGIAVSRKGALQSIPVKEEVFGN